jgi:hypothetical protein
MAEAEDSRWDTEKEKAIAMTLQLSLEHTEDRYPCNNKEDPQLSNQESRTHHPFTHCLYMYLFR